MQRRNTAQTQCSCWGIEKRILWDKKRRNPNDISFSKNHRQRFLIPAIADYPNFIILNRGATPFLLLTKKMLPPLQIDSFTENKNDLSDVRK